MFDHNINRFSASFKTGLRREFFFAEFAWRKSSIPHLWFCSTPRWRHDLPAMRSWLSGSYLSYKIRNLQRHAALSNQIHPISWSLREKKAAKIFTLCTLLTHSQPSLSLPPEWKSLGASKTGARFDWVDGQGEGKGRWLWLEWIPYNQVGHIMFITQGLLRL